ncbi:HTTM domain-containing protein [Nannocystis sp.]|uniref:HTTM domain-containing protein n=1 Tax=Nannocystis sp. TaxID=1962667 RepID=UPI0025DC444C|nr:HTTM domain-containing protein [Nannocystis sp.]
MSVHDHLSPGTSGPWRPLRAVDRWFRAELPPTRLAALRCLIGGFATVYLAIRVVHLISFVDFAPDSFAPVGVVSLLAAPLPPALVIGPVLLALPLGLAFTLGWRFAVTGPGFAALLLWVLSYRNSWGMIFHTENLMVAHVIILGLARSADAWSLDARRAPAVDRPHAHGWPVRLLALVTVATYLLAGIAKLRLSGLEWVSSDLLRNYIAYDNLRKLELGDTHSPLGAALVGKAWLFPPLAGLSLVLELLAPVALLGPRLARVWALGAFAFHLGVLAVMAIFFPYPLLGLAFAPLFAVEGLPLWRWLRLAPSRAIAFGPRA